MTASAIKPAYIGELGESLARSIDLNRSVVESVKGDVPKLMGLLNELAEGIWQEKTYTGRDGEEKRKVYQREPCFNAVYLLLKLAGVSPKENADTLLSITRAQSSIADTSLKLEQRRLVIETALTMARNRIAADRSLVDEESIEAVVSKCVLDMLGFIQHLQLDEFPVDDVTKERFVERYKDRCLQVFNDAIDALPGQGALEPVLAEPAKVDQPKTRRGRKPKKRPSAAFGDDVSEGAT